MSKRSYLWGPPEMGTKHLFMQGFSFEFCQEAARPVWPLWEALLCSDVVWIRLSASASHELCDPEQIT